MCAFNLQHFSYFCDLKTPDVWHSGFSWAEFIPITSDKEIVCENGSLVKRISLSLDGYERKFVVRLTNKSQNSIRDRSIPIWAQDFF